MFRGAKRSGIKIVRSNKTFPEDAAHGGAARKTEPGRFLKAPALSVTII
jgi:hypothetical protein